MRRSAQHGRGPMRRHRAGTERTKPPELKQRGKSRAYLLPRRLFARPVCPSSAAASRNRYQKKNARLWKESGVRGVTFYSGPASKSIVVFFVVVLFPVALGQADQAAFARRVDGAVLAAGPQVD